MADGLATSAERVKDTLATMRSTLREPHRRLNEHENKRAAKVWPVKRGLSSLPHADSAARAGYEVANEAQHLLRAALEALQGVTASAAPILKDPVAAGNLAQAVVTNQILAQDCHSS
eukprot:jgi/Mesvir1/20002/Mv13258-RA.1